MSDVKEDAESGVKSVEELLKLEGNDELKFGLLIGLIKVNQVSNKDVVNTVLHLLVGGEFDIEANFVIQDAQNILHMLKVLEQCPDTLKAEIWSVFMAMLKKSRRNLQACTEVGLISLVMDLLLDSADMVADLLVDMLGMLAAYSITVRELKLLFRYLKAVNGQWPRHSVKLISVLKHMPQRQGPDEFFSFPGKKGSCLQLPPIKTWPYVNGWTFSCWLRLDPVTGVTVERERPYLYCFHTNKGVGYSANFLGNSLVITSMKVKGKGFQHCAKYDFQPRRWYMVSIVHVYNRWSKSEIRCYVDGQLASGTDMSWLVSTPDPFDKCYVGGSSEGDVDHMFCGQLSALYLFSEALSPQQISSIYELGPSYKSQFRFPNECQVKLTDTAQRLVYDGKLTSIMVFMYNPIACDSQLCLESSPKGNSTTHFLHSPHAMMQGDVKAVITHSIHSSLHSLGGVQILFPLFGQLDLPVTKAEEAKPSVDNANCANLLGLLYNLIESSSTVQQQMIQNKGFLVIGHLLEKSSRDHITPAVLEVFLKLTNYLVKLPTGGTLLKHLFDHILFSPALWIHSCMEVQTKLYCYLATDFINDAQIYNNIRRVSAVLQTMHALKYYYWVVNPKDRSGITPKAVDGPRPEYDEIVKLRSFMLLYLKQLLLKGQGVQDEELQSMLNYLCTLHEDDNLVDVLELLISLMAEHPPSMVPTFDSKQGIRTVFKLLASPSEYIRVKTLKLLGFWLMRSTPKRKQEALSSHNLFSLLGERLLLNEQYISMATYNVLFELLTERMSLEFHKVKHEEPEGHFRIENSAILKVVATMIRQSQIPEPEVMKIKKVFLADLTILCQNNKENRRTVLQMSVWQDWLFSMAYVYPQNQEQHKITDMVMSLFRMLLHHAIKFEYGGWRVWIDTLAILHSKVAYEDFKIHMAKMYRQYDMQRVDENADAEERSQQPISTISGVSDAQLNKPVPKSTVKITELKDNDPILQNSTNGTEDAKSENEAEGGKGAEAASQSNDSNENKGGANSGEADSGESETASTAPDQKQPEQTNGASGHSEKRKLPTRTESTRSGHRMFNSGPRAPPFRIPEFRWSYLHQKLLSDLLFSVETDVQVWKSHTTRTVIDFVNAGENNIYVVNVTHMISQLADNLITSCGGLLPLLAAATSSTGEVEILEPTQGLSIEQAVSILLRIMNLTDILVFASSTNFAELEQEKNMPAGGILRQCLRLVCTAAVRNSLEVRHRQVPPTPPTPTSTSHPLSRQHSRGQNGATPDPIQALIDGSHPTQKNIVENLNEQTSPIKDLDKLLQDMDINRLRAVVYRDVEETKQAQFLALAIVYFTSVLMVSKYRDILEPPSPANTPSQSSRKGSLQSPADSKDLEEEDDDGEEEDEEEEEEEVSESQSGTGEETATGESQESSAVGESEGASPRRPETEGEESAEEVSKSDGGEEEEEEKAESEQVQEEQSEEDKSEEQTEPDGKEAEAAEGSDKPKSDQEAENKDDESKDKPTADTADIKEDTEPENKEDAKLENKEDIEPENKEDTKPENMEDTKPENKEDTKPENKEDAKPEDVKVEVTAEETKQESQQDANDETGDAATSKKAEFDSDQDSKDESGESSEASDSPRDHPTVISPVSGEQMPISSISGASGKPSDDSDHKVSNKPEKLELQNTPIPAPVNLSMLDSGNLTERLEKALGSVAPLLREIFVDFAPYLSKTLIGSHGQELLIGGLVTLKQSTSVVELVMLLCSQEWQNSLQKHAGLAFIELVNEGRLLAHATRDHIVRVANEADFILNRMRAEDVQKHAEFESMCAQMMLDRREEEKLCDHLITSAKRRDHAIAMKLRDKVLNILSNKHGAWGDKSVRSEFWKLDVWEDDSRRRRRFICNVHGSTHPEATLKAALEHGATEDAINQAREKVHEYLADKRNQSQQPDFTDEELLMEENEFEREYSGPVAMSTPCKLIAPGVAINGLMSITMTDLYFEMDEDDEENKAIDPQVLTYIDYLHGKWNFNEIRAIFSRRYLLQNVAIEIFLANRTAVMFAFPDHSTVKKVINILPRVGVGIKYGLGQARRMSQASGKQLFKMSSMTSKWQRREISNYDYLMYLNTIAGRTYNDLNQYPVFPWVIVNYDTDELDLSQPSNFRDLSKPIGALNPSRKEFFEERYNSWEHDQIPPFHYGTHYSTAAFTLNWLIRVEPFTSLFLNLQGGKFDHADRTFFSVSQAWKNCQRDTSDVKELIPEFYCLPEMFMNLNGYKFGNQDDGTEVVDVVLPQWAKNPEDFVRINRMALESEFVSCQLHHWIDLIFGYKQRGPEAVRATNVFYYLTYEGSVNLESIKDPVMREAVENQIRCFGQTPTQLLAEPHPPRSSVMHLSPMMFSSVQDDVCMIMKFLSNSPVCHVSANTHPVVPCPAVTTITCNHNYAINKWNNSYQHQGTPTSFQSQENKDVNAPPNLPLSMDQLIVSSTPQHQQRRTLGGNFDQRLKVNQSHFVTTADNRFIFACGFWDKSFRLFLADTAKILQVVFGHFDVVTCITRSECNLNQDCYVITGSKDCTVLVWMFTSRNQAIIGDNGSTEHPTPKATLTGHNTEVTCVGVLAELGMVISGSKGGPCLVHTLNGDLLRSLDAPGNQARTANLVAMSRETFAIIKFDKGDICNFSVNGRLLKHVQHKDNIQTMTLSRDGQYLMMGGDSGVVEVWRAHDLTLLYTYPACDSSICSLCLSHDHK